MNFKPIALTIIFLKILYFIGASLTGLVPLEETCCTGEDCTEENKCTFSYPQAPAQTTINIALEIIAIALILIYLFIKLQEKKSKK